MINELYKDIQTRMDKSIESLREELTKIRTGRANPALLDGIKVEYYGNPTPLNQIASISVLEASMLVVQPWDKKAVTNIEKAILKADLGLVPSNDGQIIRLPIPHLTEERREELVKVVRRFAENAKIAVRNIRRDGNEQLKILI